MSLCRSLTSIAPLCFSVFVDLCNDLNFLLVFLLGYAVAAADDEGMKEVIERGRWYNFIIGRIKKQSGQI